jgi:hypothetical protein
MRSITFPTEPVAAFLPDGDCVNEAADHAEFISKCYGMNEASGLRNALYLNGVRKTLVLVLADRDEFISFLTRTAKWRRL